MAPTTQSSWVSLPGSIRSAGIIALVTAIVAGALLYTADLSVAPDAAEGDNAAGDLVNRPDGTDAPDTTASPGPTPVSRSQAVVIDPGDPDPQGVQEGFAFPAFGTYVYGVEGGESGSGINNRTFTQDARMRVHRPADADLADDRVVFDLDLSPQHTEREVYAYTADGLFLTSESLSVNSAVTPEAASFEPAILHIPSPLEEGDIESGSSRATGPDGGTVRTEDWAIDVSGTETLQILGEAVDTVVVTVQRNSDTSSTRLSSTKVYWVDPARGIWVRWQETLSWSEPGLLLSRDAYETRYTATLERIQPL